MKSTSLLVRAASLVAATLWVVASAASPKPVAPAASAAGCPKDVLVPESSRVRASDAGQRAHTNVLIREPCEAPPRASRPAKASRGAAASSVPGR